MTQSHINCSVQVKDNGTVVKKNNYSAKRPCRLKHKKYPQANFGKIQLIDLSGKLSSKEAVQVLSCQDMYDEFVGLCKSMNHRSLAIVLQ